MATVERYSSFEEMDKAEKVEEKSITKNQKKKKLTTIREFVLLLRKNVLSPSSIDVKKLKP